MTPDNVSQAEALLPCPFCGGEALTEERHAGWIARCGPGFETCEINGRTHHAKTEAKAIAAWNTRTYAKEATPSDSVELIGWRCFHCDDVFTDERCARLHFGPDEDSAPACQIKAGAEQGLLGALRDAERAAADAQWAVANESTDAAKAYFAQMTRHNQALRNAEEAGYERGLADGRALTLHVEPEAKGERYRHLKRGTVYGMVGTAELQAEQLQGDHAELAIYRGEDGKLWARNTAEFHDGRFERVHTLTQPVQP